MMVLHEKSDLIKTITVQKGTWMSVPKFMDISLKTKHLNLLAALEEKSGNIKVSSMENTNINKSVSQSI